MTSALGAFLISSTIPASVIAGPTSAMQCRSMIFVSRRYLESIWRVQSVTKLQPLRLRCLMLNLNHLSRMVWSTWSVILMQIGSGVSVFHEISSSCHTRSFVQSLLICRLTAAIRSTFGTRGALDRMSLRHKVEFGRHWVLAQGIALAVSTSKWPVISRCGTHQ